MLGTRAKRITKVHKKCVYVNHKLYFLGTGGLSHNLWLLGNSIYYAEKYKFKIYPILQIANSFRVDFYDLYDVKDETKPLFADQVDLFKIKTIKINETLVAIEKIKLIHIKSFTYKLNNINHSTDKLKILKKDAKSDFVTTGHFKTKQYFIPILARWHRKRYLKKSLDSLRLTSRIKEFILDKSKDLPPRFIGVHFRNTDMLHNFQYIYIKLKILIFFTRIKDVYWATDDYESLININNKLPNHKIINLSNIDVKNKSQFLNLHNLNDSDLLDMGISKKQQMMDVFLDVFILGKSTYFIGSRKSGLSLMVQIFRKKFLKQELDFFQ